MLRGAEDAAVRNLLPVNSCFFHKSSSFFIIAFAGIQYGMGGDDIGPGTSEAGERVDGASHDQSTGEDVPGNPGRERTEAVMQGRIT